VPYFTLIHTLPQLGSVADDGSVSPPVIGVQAGLLRRCAISGKAAMQACSLIRRFTGGGARDLGPCDIRGVIAEYAGKRGVKTAGDHPMREL
jgi:hypothetical protein